MENIPWLTILSCLMNTMITMKNHKKIPRVTIVANQHYIMVYNANNLTSSAGWLSSTFVCLAHLSAYYCWTVTVLSIIDQLRSQHHSHPSLQVSAPGLSTS